MPVKLIKLSKKEDIASVIQKIKSLAEKEVVFELEKGSLLLKNSANLKLMKRTGEAFGKKVRVRTNDELGKMLAAKAGILFGQKKADAKKFIPKSSRLGFRPGFSDIRSSLKILPQTTVKSLAGTILKKGLPKIQRPKISATSKKIWRASLIGIAALLILAVVFWTVLPSASITIYARSQPVTRDLEVTVDATSVVPNITDISIPGFPIRREASQTKNFSSTGTSLTGTKATGEIVIYNFTSNTLTLRASTTTLTADGKNFFFTRDATGLRPTVETVGGEIDPDSLNAPVAAIAEGVGESFNIPVDTKLVIQNAALGNRPEVYAVVTKAFTGGTSKASLVVSEDDLSNAESTLSQELVSDVENELKSEVGGNVKFLPSGVFLETLAKTSNKNAGDAVDNFDFTMIARLSGLAFDETDLRNVILEQIQSVLSDDKYLVEGAKEKLVASFKSLDLDNNRGVLSVHFETVVAFKIDQKSLSKFLTGKTQNEIREILLTKPEIDRVDVKFSPFFVRKAPRFTNKIQIQTVLSDF